ncbi:MAG: hypothetical protein NW216_09030 [Hyphomicrobium sp.]|nr:hypothetical protein [Hyphomicrobium sp.]
MTRQPISLPVIALALTAVGVGGLLVRQATFPIDISPVFPEPAAVTGASGSPSTANPGDAGAMPARAPLDPAAVAEISTRPLFASDRKPFVAPPPSEVASTPAAAEAVADGFRLVGTMRTGGRDARALIRQPDRPAAEWVEIGKEIGGWRLDAIEKDRAVLKRGDRLAELKLDLRGPVPVDAP